MKIVFFGTPDYVVPIVDGLYRNFKTSEGSAISAVVTQSPKPAGRDKKIVYSAVDSWAHKHSVPVFFQSKELIENGVKADVAILASYGEIIPQDIINYFPHGILVIHPSLLPQFRWSSPVPAALVTDTNPTGVSIIRMDDKFDHGPLVSQFKEEVRPDDNYETLRNRLFSLSTKVLIQMLPPYLNGKIKLKPQDDSQATYAKMVVKDDAFIPLAFLLDSTDGKTNDTSWQVNFILTDGNVYIQKPTPKNLDLFIRAMYPWPGAWTLVNLGPSGQAKRLKILKAHVENNKLVLDEVQLEGKNKVGWLQFKSGYPAIDFN